jgi:hypothetical protein
MSLGDFIKNPTQTILKHTVNKLDNEDGKNDKGVMDALFSNPSLLRISTKNSKQQIYPKSYSDESITIIKSGNGTGLQIFSIIIGIIAAVLSWYSNTGLGYTTLEKIFFSVFAFFFGILYLFYYFIVRYNETRILNNL